MSVAPKITAKNEVINWRNDFMTGTILSKDKLYGHIVLSTAMMLPFELKINDNSISADTLIRVIKNNCPKTNRGTKVIIDTIIALMDSGFLKRVAKDTYEINKDICFVGLAEEA